MDRNYVSWTCPVCGGQCDSSDNDLLVCEYCGSKFTVKSRDEQNSTFTLTCIYRNEAKMAEIEFKKRKYEDARADEEEQRKLKRIYAELPWYERWWMNFTLWLSDAFLMHPVWTVIGVIFVLLAIASAVYFGLIGRDTNAIQHSGSGILRTISRQSN